MIPETHTEILRITRSEDGDVEVWQDGKTTRALNIGEIIGQVIALLGPLTFRGYAMRTPADWEVYYSKRKGGEA